MAYAHTLLRRRIFVNLELPEREYSKRGEHMCYKDGYVAFRNSELICGRVGKVCSGALPKALTKKSWKTTSAAMPNQ